MNWKNHAALLAASIWTGFVIIWTILFFILLTGCTTPSETTEPPELPVQILGVEMEETLIEEDTFHGCYNISVTENTGLVQVTFRANYEGQWIDIEEYEINYHMNDFLAQNVVKVQDCVHVTPLELIIDGESTFVPVTDFQGLEGVVNAYGSKTTDKTTFTLN